jgi:hypothetical protein
MVLGLVALTAGFLLDGSLDAMTRSSAFKFAQAGTATPQTAKPGTNQTPGQPSRPDQGRGLGPVPGAGRSGPPSPRTDFYWWKDADIVRQLGLTAAQTSKIDNLYEKRLKQIALVVDEYDKQRADLDRMSAERVAQPAAIELQASKMMTAKVTIDISRIRMLYEMSLVMSREQNDKLKDIADRFYREQRERGRGRNPSGR